MRSYKTDAIIVKRRNFGEADRVLTVLTKNYGKIQVKAPGVRRITSRRSSHIELLNLVLLTLYRSSRSSLPILTEAQALEEFLSIKKTLRKIGFAYYICELIDTLCAEREENRRIFFLTKDTLFKLADLKIDFTQDLYSRHSGLSRISLNHGDSGCPAFTRMTDSEKGLSIVSDFEDELLVLSGFLPRQHKLVDKMTFIESILEKKLRTRRLLPLFLNSDKC